MKFPKDENGEVLRRMQDGGDDLSKSRQIDFCLVFPQRRQALAFATVVDERDYEVCISWYPERKSWQVIVQHTMVPTHAAITKLELDLAKRAESAGGEPDGWGCMQIDKE